MVAWCWGWIGQGSEEHVVRMARASNCAVTVLAVTAAVTVTLCLNT